MKFYKPKYDRRLVGALYDFDEVVDGIDLRDDLEIV
tara:strand:+ start:4855 stop:4962 length:108 start_codon:yes stop_codon:yes gene_type:complete